MTYRPLSREQLLAIKPGDVIERLLAFAIPMYLRVGKVEDGIIDAGWTFSQETGLEVDEDLSFSASYIRRVLTDEEAKAVKITSI